MGFALLVIPEFKNVVMSLVHYSEDTNLKEGEKIERSYLLRVVRNVNLLGEVENIVHSLVVRSYGISTLFNCTLLCCSFGVNQY